MESIQPSPNLTFLRFEQPIRLGVSTSGLFGLLAILAFIGLFGLPAAAQTVMAPSQPLRLIAPRALPPSTAQQWNRLPQEGVVLDPGASDAFDAADPASPFQSPTSAAPRFGSKIPVGLPDVDRAEKPVLRSELVSNAGPGLAEAQGDEDMLDDGQDDQGDTKKSARQRSSQQRRLAENYPRDFLLDSADPGLFQFLSDQWVPTRSSDGKEPRSRLESAADAAWQELRPQLLTKLQACDMLLRKNSIYSARDEIRSGLALLARKLDQITVPGNAQAQRKAAIRKSMPHELALQHALREIDQCAYAPHHELAQTLETFSDLIPQATLNHPWAADLLYALGKTYERELEYAPKQQDVLRQQSLECYKVALRMAPSRGYIANQLGYSYLHTGSLDEAAKAMQQALDAGPTAYSWRNLAELYRRRGAIREAQLADEQAEFLLSEAAKKP